MSQTREFRQLDPAKLTEKIQVLERRVRERFPDSGLSRVCAELHDLAGQTSQACARIARPHWWLRVGVGAVVVLIVVLIVVGLVESIISFKLPQRVFDLTEFIQVLEPAMNAVVLIGAAIFFLVTVETRVKRSRTLKAISQLRAIAHVIDMHQLTKDPARIWVHVHRTPSSPPQQLTPFELTRYLDYCSEMLSLVGKVAALYAQHFGDAVVLAAVNEVEALTTGLSRKIWQKIMIINLCQTNRGFEPEAGSRSMIVESDIEGSSA